MTTTVLTANPIAREVRPAQRVNVVPTLTMRRLALMIRSPRSVAIPLLAPLLFALVVAPALANSITSSAQHTTYMTLVAMSGAGLLIPLNCMFAGLGMVIDRQQGALRELLVAPIRRGSIVLANLFATLVITAVQVSVLLFASALRGADYATGRNLLWFLAGAVLFAVVIYGIAEMLATKIASAEEFTGTLPVIAIVPFFFAGSLYPITSLPGWLAGVAKVLPLTHALALFRYGLTAHGAQGLHNIWGMTNDVAMASLSLGVVALYAAVALVVAMRMFIRAGTS
jgi:ABC-2 type transport system permease protein